MNKTQSAVVNKTMDDANTSGNNTIDHSGNFSSSYIKKGKKENQRPSAVSQNNSNNS